MGGLVYMDTSSLLYGRLWNVGAVKTKDHELASQAKQKMSMKHSKHSKKKKNDVINWTECQLSLWNGIDEYV